MKNKVFLTAAALGVLAATAVNADEVRLKDGTVIKGSINGVEGGVLSITPGYNADASVKAFRFKLEDIISFNTEEPLYIGTSVAKENAMPDNIAYGKVDAGTAGGIQVTTEIGVTQSPIEAIQAAWRTPEESPQEKARKKLERHWAYSFFTDITGKSGNSDSIGVTVGFDAVNKSIDDELRFYGRYNFARTDGNKSADDLSAGVEYTSRFASPLFWYARSDNGFDKVQMIDFYSTAAVGGGTELIKSESQKWEVRLGLAYRYESYENGTTYSKPGLDVGSIYEYKWDWVLFKDTITYTPAFEDFANFVVKHDAYLEMPLANSENWKLRVGMTNDYNSRPQSNVERLDTTYYARLVLSLK